MAYPEAGDGTQAEPVFSPGGFVTLTSQITRPADTTPYAAGDLVANSVTAGLVTPFTFVAAVRLPGEAIRIERARLRKSSQSLANASFRVCLLRDLPTLSVGDNGTFDASNVLAINDIAAYVGAFDITMDKAAVSGARGVGVPTVGAGITTTPPTGSTLYALVQTTAAYTPASLEVFTLTLEGART